MYEVDIQFGEDEKERDNDRVREGGVRDIEIHIREAIPLVHSMK